MTQTIEELAKEQSKLDRKIIDYSIKLLQPFYSKRRNTVREIPRFWPTVFADSDPLRPYILLDDCTAFDELYDLWIEWDQNDTRNFTISFYFNDNHHFKAQCLTKAFVWHENDSNDNSEGYYTSPEKCNITWKSEQNLGNQHLQGGEESFFTWFDYTTTEKEEDREENTAIAQLITDGIYPNALELFRASQDEKDIEEEYDISD